MMMKPQLPAQVALGCAKLGQLLVWDWRAETYVLKQQGHFYDVGATAYSPDGALLASGADDSKVLCNSRGIASVCLADCRVPTGRTFSALGPCCWWALKAGMSLAIYASAGLIHFSRAPLLSAQVKVWSLASGFCLVTFADHGAPVTGVAWLPSGSAVLSSSLVGSTPSCAKIPARLRREPKPELSILTE